METLNIGTELSKVPTLVTNNEVEPEQETTIDFSEYMPSSLKPKVKEIKEVVSKANPSVLSIVNTIGNGKRIRLGARAYEHIGKPNTFQICYNKNSIIIAKKFPSCKIDYTFSKDRNSYCTNLVTELTNYFNLDFSKVTSISLYDAEYLTHNDIPIVKVTVKKDTVSSGTTNDNGKPNQTDKIEGAM